MHSPVDGDAVVVASFVDVSVVELSVAVDWVVVEAVVVVVARVVVVVESLLSLLVVEVPCQSGG